MVVSGTVEGNLPEAPQSAYRYTCLHHGFHAWAIYVFAGLSLANHAYTRDMALTIRSGLTPLFGFFGHVVDVLGVIATIPGVSVTIGYSVSQFIDSLYAITGLIVIMGLSIISAVSGVGRGVKYRGT